MQKSTLIKVLVIGAILVFIIYQLFLGNDEAKIRDIVSDLQQSITAENIGGTFSDVSLEYQDESGVKYLPAKYIMNRFYEMTDQVNLRVNITDIQIQGKEAVARLEIILTGNRDGQTYHILGSPDNPMNIDIGLEKGLIGWKIHSTKNIRPSSDFMRGR